MVIISNNHFVFETVLLCHPGQPHIHCLPALAPSTGITDALTSTFQVVNVMYRRTDFTFLTILTIGFSVVLLFFCF